MRALVNLSTGIEVITRFEDSVRLTVIGTGYVGLVTAACFAEMGNAVVCVDSDREKIEGLRRHQVPFFEPGLQELVARNHDQGRLDFVDTLAAANNAEVYVFAVGTPPNHDGSVDLRQVLSASRNLGRVVTHDFIVVQKSTAPVGTVEEIKEVIDEELAQRKVRITFEVASNPEFLKEGSAVNDFMRPERIIIGTESERVSEILRVLYAPFTRSHERVLFMSVRDAEMTKYIANAMLATRISFMNEIAAICEEIKVDIENVRRGIGSDSRIGHAFLYAGVGYGGSCFPKDMQGLIHMAKRCRVEPRLLEAVEWRNHAQKLHLLEKIYRRFGSAVRGLVVGIWGLSFKPGTDDLREAPSVTLINHLLGAGARIRAYDPAAIRNARRSFPPEWFGEKRMLELVDNQYDAVQGADALVLMTEWMPFRNPDFDLMSKLMRCKVIFDGRNQYEPMAVRTKGFEYYGFGRG